MPFPFNVYALAAGSAFVTTVLALPLWRVWCRRTGLVDEPGHRKIHGEAIPLAGGLAVWTGLAVPLVAATVALANQWVQPAAVHALSYGLGRRQWQLLALLGGALGMLLLGWWDDRAELPPLPKFGGQVLVAAAVAASGVRITLFVPSLTFSFAITVLWVLTVTNAFNFTDNMNGLCAGLGLIGALGFGCHAAAAGQYLVALLAFLVTGALAGFLPYNFPRASVFLGDAGSHLIGYLLAVLAILPHFYTPAHRSAWAVLDPLLILAVPLADLVTVVVVRWRLVRPFYVGDTNHFSHRLVRRGWSARAAVLLLWGLMALTVALARW